MIYFLLIIHQLILCSVLEYLTREDADRACKELDGKELRGQCVRVQMGEEVSSTESYLLLTLMIIKRGPDNYRRDDRGHDRYDRGHDRHDRGHDRERYRDERDRYERDR